jgi:hypothetical protein
MAKVLNLVEMLILAERIYKYNGSSVCLNCGEVFKDANQGYCACDNDD